MAEEIIFAGNSALYTPSHAISSGVIKIYATGDLTASGSNRDLIIRVNGRSTGYKSYTRMTQMAEEGSVDLIEDYSNGMGVARSSKGEDASFLVDYTLSMIPESHIVNGSGTATFAQSSNVIRGFQSYGFIALGEAITSLELIFSGGTATDSLVKIVRH